MSKTTYSIFVELISSLYALSAEPEEQHFAFDKHINSIEMDVDGGNIKISPSPDKTTTVHYQKTSGNGPVIVKEEDGKIIIKSTSPNDRLQVNFNLVVPQADVKINLGGGDINISEMKSVSVNAGGGGKFIGYNLFNAVNLNYGSGQIFLDYGKMPLNNSPVKIKLSMGAGDANITLPAQATVSYPKDSWPMLSKIVSDFINTRVDPVYDIKYTAGAGSLSIKKKQ